MESLFHPTVRCWPALPPSGRSILRPNRSSSCGTSRESVYWKATRSRYRTRDRWRCSPSGEHIVIGATSSEFEGQMLLWNVADETVEKQVRVRGGFRVVFSPDGSRIGTTGGVWRSPSLEAVFELKGGGGYAFDLGPRNRLLARPTPDLTGIEIRSAEDGHLIQTLTGHHDIVLCVRFSPEGTRLVSTGLSGIVIVWNLSTGQEILRYRDHDSWAWSAVFSPDGQMLATCQDGRSKPAKILIRRAVSDEDARRLLSRARRLQRVILPNPVCATSSET